MKIEIFFAEAAIFDSVSSEEFRGKRSVLIVFARVPEIDRHFDCLNLQPCFGLSAIFLTIIIGESLPQPFSSSSERNEMRCGLPSSAWIVQRRLKWSLLAFEMSEEMVRCPLFSSLEPGTDAARDAAIRRDSLPGFLPVVISTDEHP